MKYKITESKTGHLSLPENMWNELHGVSVLLKVGDQKYRQVYVNDWVISQLRDRPVKPSKPLKTVSHQWPSETNYYYNEDLIELIVQAKFEDYFILYVSNSGPSK